jgi:hypothetical protein
LIVEFPDPHGRPPQRLDFSRFAVERPTMARDFAMAFRHHYADKEPQTRRGAFQSGISRWFRFLAAPGEHAAEAKTTRDITAPLLRAYIHWLRDQRLGGSTCAAFWTPLHGLLLWLRRNRPELLAPDLDIPRGQLFSRDDRRVVQGALSSSDLDVVLAACRQDIDRIWADFRRGQDLLASADMNSVASTQVADLDLRDLGTLLAVLRAKFGSLIPAGKQMRTRGAGLWTLVSAIIAHGGATAVGRLLHADGETLLPFMLAIGAQTYANPEALRLMRRNCMVAHLLLEGRWVVTWEKGRASRPQRRSFLRDRSYSVPNLIDRVLAMTAPLIPHVPTHDQDKLFLSATRSTWRKVQLTPKGVLAFHLERFVARHRLVHSDGAPMRLTFASLRVSGLSLAHAALGGDVLKTQVVANHVSPRTTWRYVAQPVIRAAQTDSIATLQAAFVSWVQRDPEEIARSLGVPSATAVEIAAGQNATASGFICRDPLAGVAPGQQRGHLCVAWLGCFTCPNAVIPLDVDTLARLLRSRDALIAARTAVAADRWDLLYAPKLQILEHDILPRFPQQLVREAAGLALSLPRLPPIE